jgi:hypothetical protein
MARKPNPSLIGPRLKYRGFFSQRVYTERYFEKLGRARIWTPEQRAAARITTKERCRVQYRTSEEYRFSKRVAKLKLVHEFTLAQYRQMLVEQGNACWICHRKFSAEMPPCIDHDHEAHIVRHLLCDPCNIGIGTFKESPDWLRRAALYLETHRKGI